MSLARDLTPAPGRHALVTVAGLGLVFTAMTGGNRVAEWEVDDSTGAPQLRVGRVRTEPIVLTAALSPHRDLEGLVRLKAAVGIGRYTITRQWTDANWTPVGDPELYPDCVLVGVTNPETGDTADEVSFSLTFATTGEAL